MKSGIYYDISAKLYFSDPALKPSLTQSIAKILIDKSPAHAFLKHPRLGKTTDDDDDDPKQRKAKDIGNVAHKLVLGRGREVDILQYDNYTTKDARLERADSLAAGRLPILESHNQIAVDLANEVLRQTGNAFTNGNSEVCLIWEEDGTWFRTLIDYLKTGDGVVYDLKTSAKSCAPGEIPKRIMEDGWDIQAAMQERGLQALGIVKFPVFRFVPVEQQPPHGCTVNQLGNAVMQVGRDRLGYAIDMWKHCCKTGNWPGYPPGIQFPEIPNWAENKWQEREMRSLGLVPR